MVHDEMERGLIPVVAKRLGLADDDLTVRLCAAAVTGAFRVVDEDVSRAIVVDEREVTQQEALSLIDRAIREATNGRLGGPIGCRRRHHHLQGIRAPLISRSSTPPGSG